MFNQNESSVFNHLVCVMMLLRHTRDEDGEFTNTAEEAAAIAVAETKALVDQMKKQDCLPESLSLTELLGRIKEDPGESDQGG